MNKNERIKIGKRIALAKSRNEEPAREDYDTLEDEGCCVTDCVTFLAFTDKTGEDLALKYPKRNRNTVFAYDYEEYRAYEELTKRLAQVSTMQALRGLERSYSNKTWKHASLRNELEEGFEYIEKYLKEGVEEHKDEPAPTLWDNAVMLADRGMSGVEFALTSICLWANGNTRPHKEELKAAGFRWAPKRKAWYFKIPSAV